MKYKMTLLSIGLLSVAGCLSTSDQAGPDASAWDGYKSWQKITTEPNTGDPTGFLGKVHEGLNALRDIYVNDIGLAVNRGERPFPYPAGTILVKETFRDRSAWEAQTAPDLTIMLKLSPGSSPETADWEYVMGADGSNRGTGTSGLAMFCHSCHTAAAATDYGFINAAFLSSHGR